MYLPKLNYLRNCIGSQDKCLNGVLKKQSECGASISTPCICVLPDGVDINEDENGKPNTPDKKPSWFLVGEIPITQKKGKGNGNIVKIKAQQLRQWPIEKIQRSVDRCHTPLEVYSLWPPTAIAWQMMGNINPLVRILARKGSVTILNDLPLIYDNNFLQEPLDLRSKSLQSLPGEMLGILKNYRYANYTIAGINKSNFNEYFGNGLIRVVETFTKHFPVQATKIRHDLPAPDSGFRMRCLVDIVSISFYRLKDIIPIFDHKNTKGVAMEILITNSSITGAGLFEAGRSIVGLFIFGNSSENITFLDGVPINTVVIGKGLSGKVSSPLNLVASYPALLAPSIPNSKAVATNSIIYRTI